MAQTFDGAQYPDALRFTTSGTPNNVTEVVIPARASKASVRFDTNAGKLAFEGTDGAAVGSHFCDIDANTWAEFGLGDGIGTSKGVGSIFVASGTATTTVTVLIEG